MVSSFLLQVGSSNLLRSVSKWGNKSNPLIFVIWELDQKARSKNKHRANGMKNDSLWTGSYIDLGEERHPETWLNCAAEQTLHVCHAFLNAALGCPCGCRRCFCRKGGEGRWNPVLSSSPLFWVTLPSPQDGVGLFHLCDTRHIWVPEIGKLDWWCWTWNLKATGICIREDGVAPGVKDKKVCRLEENYPLPKPQCAKPYFSPMTSYLTSLQHPVTLQGASLVGGQNEPCFYFIRKVSP